MHELSDDARSILDLVRDADNPTDRDRRRVTGAMVAELGAAAVVASSTTAAASGGTGTVAAAAGVSLGTKVLASMAMVGLVAGGAALQNASSVTPRVRDAAPLVVHTASVERTAERTAPLATVDLPQAAAAPVPTTPVDPPAIEARRAAAHGPAQTTPAAQGALAIEVGVLGSVRSALRAGEPLRALALLDAHRATFARGMLREEYLAARVMALRDLGRLAEAAAAASQFAAEMPHSPLAPDLAARTETEPHP